MVRKNAEKTKTLHTTALETLSDKELNEVVGGSKGGNKVTANAFSIVRRIDVASPVFF